MRLYSFLLKQITPSKPVHTATCYLNTCCRSRSRDYSDSVNCSRLSELFLSLLRQVLEYIFKILFFLKSLLKSTLFSRSIKLIRRSIVNGAAALVQVLGQLPENFKLSAMSSTRAMAATTEFHNKGWSNASWQFLMKLSSERPLMEISRLWEA